MYKFLNKIVRLFCLCVFLFGHSSADAQNRNLPADINPYFGPVGKQAVMPNAAGFIQRWLLLEPISMPVKSNVVFTDSYLKEIFHTQYFPKQMETVPKDGAVVKVGKEKLKWHALDSKLFNVKLFRFATSFKKPKYGVLFWAVTVIDCPEEMKDVRLSVGSNGASMWWLNGEEAVMLEGDRRMVRDDVLTMWNKTLDPKSPDFKYTEPVVVASSLDDEDCDAIDAGLLLDPTTGRLWLSYGTYFGIIRLVELDPKTGKRMEGNEPVNIAIDCEATDLIYRNGWYYLLGTHGTCCDGPYYKICIEGTTRYLTATAQHDVIAKPEFTGEDAQLWRIEQLTDGTYRIMPKAVPGTEEKLALVSLGDCTPGLAPFDFNSDNSKWNFRQQ